MLEFDTSGASAARLAVKVWRGPGDLYWISIKPQHCNWTEYGSANIWEGLTEWCYNSQYARCRMTRLTVGLLLSMLVQNVRCTLIDVADRNPSWCGALRKLWPRLVEHQPAACQPLATSGGVIENFVFQDRALWWKARWVDLISM